MKVPNEIDCAITEAASKKANYRTPFSYLKSNFPAMPQLLQQQRKHLSEL